MTNRTYTPISRGFIQFEDVSRREFMAGALAAALLIACGDDDEDSSDADSSAGFPVSIDHKYGTTSIPRQPSRVVSVGFTDHEVLLGLGIKPLAVREWWGGYPYATWSWAQDELGDAKPVVLASSDLDIEAIAALKPDLIVGFYSGITEDEYRLLSGIAPTVTQPRQYVDFGMPWREQTIATGRVIGKEELARSKVAEIDALLAAAKAAHPDFVGATTVIAGPSDDGTYWVYGKEDPRSRLLEDLGFVIPPQVAALAADNFFGTISAEQARLLDVDVLIWWLEEDQANQPSTDAVYQQLNVVKQGRTAVSSWDDLAIAALSFSSILSLPYAIENLIPLLSKASKKS